MNIKKMNKKGSDFQSILYSIAIIFSIGIFLVIVSFLALQIYSNLNTTLNDNPDLAGGVPNETLTKVQEFEQSMWDYFFLAIVMTYILSMVVLAFITPTNPWIFAIFSVLAPLGLFVGVALSNAWEKMAEQPILADTIERFPITDLILNNFYPLLITFIIVLIMVMLFGKKFGGGKR